MFHLSEAARCLLFPPGRWWCHGCEAADCSDSDIPLLLPELRIGFYCAHKDTETESEEKSDYPSVQSVGFFWRVQRVNQRLLNQWPSLLALGPGPTMKVFEFVTAWLWVIKSFGLRTSGTHTTNIPLDSLVEEKYGSRQKVLPDLYPLHSAPLISRSAWSPSHLPSFLLLSS